MDRIKHMATNNTLRMIITFVGNWQFIIGYRYLIPIRFRGYDILKWEPQTELNVVRTKKPTSHQNPVQVLVRVVL